VLELIEKETLSTADMNRISERVVKRPPMAPFNGFGKRTPSDLPPVQTAAERAAAGSPGSAASTPNNSAPAEVTTMNEGSL